MKQAVIPIVVGALGTVPKGLESGLEQLETGKNRDNLEYRIFEIGQNTEKSP